MHDARDRRIACDQAALNESFYEGERYLERLFVVIGAQLGLDVVDDHPLALTPPRAETIQRLRNGATTQVSIARHHECTARGDSVKL